MDPTVELGKTIKDRLEKLREEEVNDSMLGRFNLLLKLDKGLSSVKGRPVMSNCGSITEHVSEYLDHHLNPLVSFVKNRHSTLMTKQTGTA